MNEAAGRPEHSAGLPSYDPRWDAEVYAAGRQLNRWPYDAVVSFLLRYAPPGRARDDVRVLEIGCGAGNNLWCAAREGFQVAGVDASRLAIHAATQRFREERVRGDLRVADFRALPFDDASFDLAIDRQALTCAPRAVALDAAAELQRVLRPGGHLYTNCYSTAHTSADAQGGAESLLPSRGTLAGLPRLRFYGESELAELWGRGGWRILTREHSVLADPERPAVGVHAEWRLVLERVA